MTRPCFGTVAAVLFALGLVACGGGAKPSSPSPTATQTAGELSEAEQAARLADRPSRLPALGAGGPCPVSSAATVRPTSESGSAPGCWGGWLLYTRVLTPGCYAYQIDGPNCTTIVVFRAEPES